jgi:glycosyltransferase involved in cell wall biosynthesis
MKIDMKVLMFVSNPFTSDPRVYAEAKSLIQAGHEVTVIAWDREKQNPPRQNWDGIDVVRLRTGLLPKRCRFVSPLWVGLNLILWQRQAYRQALALNKEKPLDVIHCHDFDTLAVGARLKRRLGLPLVYDAHEIYGYMMADTLPHRIANIFLWLEKRSIKRVDKIINVCEPQRRYFESITDKPISIIMNCKSLQSLEYEPPNNENVTLLYIGGLHQDRAVLMLVQAAKELPGVRCLIGGIGQPSYVGAVRTECSRTSNVTFLGRVPFDEVIPMTMKTDVVFCMFNPGDPNSIIGTPNKLFEAMVCGRPIICTKGTYSGEMTEREEVGLAVEYTEEALREAIIRLRDDPELREKLGRNALEAAIAKYNWQKEEVKLLELYKSLRGV